MNVLRLTLNTSDRGQGLNNAIHDVALLARKTKEYGFTAKAVGEYEAEMIPRAKVSPRSASLFLLRNRVARNRYMLALVLMCFPRMRPFRQRRIASQCMTGKN